MTRSTANRDKRLAELKKEVAKPGFDRHAFRLSNLGELPTDLQATAMPALAGPEAIQAIVVFPPQIQRGWHYVPKQALLFTATGVVHLLASIWPDQEPQVTCLSACNLMYLKVTLLLLYGYLEIVAQGQECPVQFGMEFNTVSWHSLSAPLWQVLSSSKSTFPIPADKFAYSANTHQTIQGLPIKFFNGVKIYGLLPGEELEDLVFQEATWKSRFHFFQRPVTADTLLLLTTNFMVVIQEDLHVKQGWILSYIPRSRIIGIQSQSYELWSKVSVYLKRENQSIDYILLLAKDAAETWRRQWLWRSGQWEIRPCQSS